MPTMHETPKPEGRVSSNSSLIFLLGRGLKMIPAEIDITAIADALKDAPVYVDPHVEQLLETQAEDAARDEAARAIPQEDGQESSQTSSQPSGQSKDFTETLTPQEKVEAFYALGDPERQPAIPEVLGDTRIAVLGREHLSIEDARDVAQRLKDSTGADTVIVQTADRPGVVSSEISRYRIENAQVSMFSSLDPGRTQTFLHVVAEEQSLLGPVNALAFIGVIAACAITALTTRVFSRMSA